jgi:hypothetical protein
MRTSSAARLSHIRLPLVAVLIVLLPALAAAQEPVKSFDQLNTRLKVGDTVWVTDAQGREVKGKIAGLTRSALTLEGDAGRTLQVDVVRLITQRTGSRVWKGTLWGLAAGGAVSLGLVLASEGCEDDGVYTCAYGIPVAVGVGAGVGAIVGALTPGKTLVVYRAPGASGSAHLSLAPVITRRTKGVAVAFSF